MGIVNFRPNIGADPEFFVLLDNKPISADRFYEGKGKGRRLFFDGFQAEINPLPNSCREIFNYNIADMLVLAKERLPKEGKIFPVATIHISKKHLEGVDSECLRFGCMPDYNIYFDERKEYPDGRLHLKRYAGGHIHVETNNIDVFKDTKMVIRAIKLMDRLAGLTSVVLSPYEDEKERREYYGQAGCYRLNKHGIEYRTPSAFWLTSPILASIMTGMTRDAVRYAPSKLADEILSYPDDEEIIEIINKCDRKSAFEMLSEYHRMASKIISNNILFHKKIEQFPIADKSSWNAIEAIYEKGGFRYFFNPSYIVEYYTKVPIQGVHSFGNALRYLSPEELKYVFDGGDEKWTYQIE